MACGGDVRPYLNFGFNRGTPSEAGTRRSDLFRLCAGMNVVGSPVLQGVEDVKRYSGLFRRPHVLAL